MCEQMRDEITMGLGEQQTAAMVVVMVGDLRELVVESWFFHKVLILKSF